MSNSTLILIIILFFFTGGLLILALNKSFYNTTNVSQTPSSSISVKNSITADTSLLFGSLEVASPSSYPKTYSLPILINTGINKATAVQLELAFDPNILTNVNITPSTFFKNPNVVISKINHSTGRISYALAASSSALAASSSALAKTTTDNAVQGEGTLAILTFESLFSSVSANITFLPKTFVTAEGLESSALKSTNSAQLTY